MCFYSAFHLQRHTGHPVGPIPMPLSHGATHRKGAQVACDVITFCVVSFDVVVVVVGGEVGTENIGNDMK